MATTVEELNKAYETSSSSKATTAADTNAAAQTGNELKATLKKVPQNGNDYINEMYNAQKDSTLASLENAYHQNLSDAQASMAQIDPTYQRSANQLDTAYERNKANFNEQAAASGINTGTHSQADLATNLAQQRDMGQLRTEQANALTEAQRGIDTLKQNYNSAVQQAIAENDYNRAQALYNQWQTDQQNALNQAATMAQYGDFSGYVSVYGQEAANRMQAAWNAQNPDLAYKTNAITAEEYKTLTGNYPKGYTPPTANGDKGNSNGNGWYQKQVENYHIAQQGSDTMQPYTGTLSDWLHQFGNM